LAINYLVGIKCYLGRVAEFIKGDAYRRISQFVETTDDARSLVIRLPSIAIEPGSLDILYQPLLIDECFTIVGVTLTKPVNELI
jgi:hypothetical protein